MEPFFVRYRNLLVLLTMLVAQLAGLAVQVHQTDSGRMSLDPRDSRGVRLIRLWAISMVSPPERLIQFSKLGVSGMWQNYLDLRHTREQNQDLEKTIDRLRLEQAALLEDARQGQRLQALMNFQEKYIYKTLAAQVIGASGSEQSQVFYIDKGADYKLERDMAVITADGIVGKVRDVFPHSSQVLAINDQTSGAGVILETTRTRGILRGNAAGQPQIVDIMADQRIQPGEKVLTAGGDMIFPRGLPVGMVQKVLRDPERDSFIDIIIQPAAHLDRLDEVLIITSTDLRFPPQQQQDIATSEALKGPEVQAELAQKAEEEQKKASAIMAERLPGLKDPNAPPEAPPVPGSTPPVTNPMPHPPPPLHPDRFTPGTATDQGTGQQDEVAPGKSAPNATGQKKNAAPSKVAGSAHSAAVPAKAKADTQPRRNP
jgi:rod shape-determining protein MreC